jgi:hypothetical protein
LIRLCAGFLVWGVSSLWSGTAGAQDQQTEATASLVIRIDDRKTHELTQPWVSLTWPDGTLFDALALDDGSDPEDAIGGDHLYICRMTVPAGKNVEVWILDSGPLNSGQLLHQTTLDLPEGRTQRINMRPPGPSPGSATTVDEVEPERASESAPVEGHPGEPVEETIPEIDPSLGFAHEATITPSRPAIRRWSARDVWGLVGLSLLGLLGVVLQRKTRLVLIQRIEGLTGRMDSLHGPATARQRPVQRY